MGTSDLIRPEVPARARFYFDHYQRIEEWARLRREAANVLHDQFAAHADGLMEEFSARPDVLCRTADIDEGGYPRVILERPGWRLPGEESAPFGIALEWERTVIDRDGLVKLYVGVRGSSEHPRHAELSVKVREAAKAWKAALPGNWSGTSDSWPCYQWVRPGDAIDELALMQSAAALQRHLFQQLTPDLDRLLAGID